MRGWLLDTNVVSELAKPHGCDPRVLAWGAALAEHTAHISILTIGEFERGIANMPPDRPHRATVTAALAALEERFAGRVLPVSDSVVRLWGTLSGDIRRRSGRWPPVIDTLLAATAICHDLVLATRNVQDVAATPARVFNPWTDDPAAFGAA